MKTKSKRFLNLATLCLALLGTTLLMAHPVKAEVVATTEGVQQQTAENEDTDTIKKDYMALFGSSDSGSLDEDSRYRGYVDGYRKGFRGEDRTDRDDINAPEDIELQYKDDYKDGYEGGFEEGRRKAYPVTAFLEAVWGFLTGIFHEWFDGAGSQ
ncbi:TPA: hypothetical protein ACNYK6_000190 [Streptococcus pyogenes]